TPLTIEPGDEIDFTISYTPTTSGVAETATVRIISNDPTAPFVDLAATGAGGAGAVATSIANAGDFGDVCRGSFADQALTINNAGPCPLTINDIIGSGDFIAPSVLSYPLLVASGASIDVTVRFAPSSYGTHVGTITVVSSDPASPNVVHVSGAAPAPKANLIIANRGNFGKACVGSFVDEPLIITNSHSCTLTVSAIVSSSPDFLVPEVLSYPITIAPGNSLPVPIRFQPGGFGSKSGSITVDSDDPAAPISISVSGDAPSGALTIAGSTTFGGVTATCCADRTLSVCNVGECSLNVTSVDFRRTSRYWKLLHNPFPATLAPGSCLPVVIQYHALEKCCRICELVIESNDPAMPVKVVTVDAYTIWPWSREDCDECRKGCCNKQHPEACRQGYPCCCVDDEEI
ncbi:MAG: choice-of-anchor D domain-containing protein, partial [Candidatus Cybelea sp.]